MTGPSDKGLKKKKICIKSVVCAVGICLAVLVAAAVVILYITPVPAALFLRSQFENPTVSKLPTYDTDDIMVERDITYPSSLAQNTLDLYLPAEHSASTPVILWAHGGAYVGGDKSDIRQYASCLAADGYAVVCINYELAPEGTYPGPLIQMGDACNWIASAGSKRIFDANLLVIAGDSAGAHLAAQYALIQTSASYAAKVNIAQMASPDSLKAVLLFCGPYDMSTLGVSQSPLVNYFLSRAGWAYFGTRDWFGRYGQQIIITDNVTSSFPPAFITDDNTGSFEKDGKELARKLKSLGVEVSPYFTPISEGTTAHEYQFDMTTTAAQESYAQVLRFLERHVG